MLEGESTGRFIRNGTRKHLRPEKVIDLTKKCTAQRDATDNDFRETIWQQNLSVRFLLNSEALGIQILLKRPVGSDKLLLSKPFAPKNP